jgi:hypothetical protein
MSQQYYRSYEPLKELSLKIVEEIQEKVTVTDMHLKTVTGVEVNLTIVKPKLRPGGIYKNLHQLCNMLSSDGIDSIRVFGESQEQNEELRWRIEIWREGGEIETIACKEIGGLPV